MTPRRSSRVHCEVLDDEVCLYDWATQEVHRLNPTATRIWGLCDGETSVEQIGTRLALELGVREAEGVVRLALADFHQKGLIDGYAADPSDRGVSRRQLVARLGLTAAALPVVSSILAPTALQAASAGSQTFSFTGAAQDFTVPAGVTSIVVDASGGQGAGNVGRGRGGRVQATITTTPGETLVVRVGGAGHPGTPPPGIGGAGGFNGGGFGGVLAGGGGGASDLRRGSALLVVAGGGGGAGGSYEGGDGGGLTGETGANGSGGTDGQGGGGGTQSGGGAGGAAGGQDGSAGTGGNGGNALLAGGGGGGGWFGGGGGGANTGPAGFGAGGGGGSSFTISAATNVVHSQGQRSGDGVIIISW